MILRRILTCLNNTGFRRYAIQLVEFLEKSIYGQVGGYELFNKKKLDQKVVAGAPLGVLTQFPDFFPTLQLYGDHQNNPEKIQALEENCFANYPEDFENSIFFLGVN